MRPLRASAAHLQVVPKLEPETVRALLTRAPGNTLTYGHIREMLSDHLSVDVIKVLIYMRNKRMVILHDDWRQLNEMRVSLPLAA